MRHRTLAICVALAAGAALVAQERAPAPFATQPAAPFVSHAENIQPGKARPFAGLTLKNPYEGNAGAAADGGKLYVAYNCIDCHGADGSGAMGPSLADARWHFGGTPAEIYESIYQGRPDGMPAWGSLIAP